MAPRNDNGVSFQRRGVDDPMIAFSDRLHCFAGGNISQ